MTGDRAVPPRRRADPDGGVRGSRIRPYLRSPDSAPYAESDDEAAPVPEGLRPFVMTTGRVDTAVPYIGLETQVTAREPAEIVPGPTPSLSPQLTAIIDLCTEPMAVAEISARLRLHIGVTRILVADLYTGGHLDVHGGDVTSAPDPELILRVIRGIRDLT